MEPTKGLKDYIKAVEERDNAKAMSDEALEELKQIIEAEQVRRTVVKHIQKLANMLK